MCRIVFIVLAFLPKVTALLVSIPSPVVAAYVMVLAALLFMQGVRIIVQDGLDYRKSIVAGLALLVGLCFETHVIFSDLISRDAMWGDLLSHGMVAGGVVAIALTLFMEFTSASRWRTELKLHAAGLPELDTFLLNVASRMRWDAAASERLRAAGEESLACLVQADGLHVEPARAPAEQGNHARRLRVVARSDQGTVELEFIAAAGEGNLEDRIVRLPDRADVPNERELSLRLLRHHASSVRHRQYHDIDVLTVRVGGERNALGARGH